MCIGLLLATTIIHWDLQIKVEGSRDSEPSGGNKVANFFIKFWEAFIQAKEFNLCTFK